MSEIERMEKYIADRYGWQFVAGKSDRQIMAIYYSMIGRKEKVRK